MAEEFVRKDVFDARMDRMEALLEKALLEMKADNEKLRREVSTSISEVKADNERLRSEMRENNTRLEAKIEVLGTRIDALDTRIDSVQTTVYWGFALMGLILAFTTFAPALLEFVKSLRKPSFTLADVENMISAAIRQARLEGK